MQKQTITSKYMFLTFQPHYPDNEEQASSVATMIFHVFAFGSYAFGLLGAALADSKAGLHMFSTPSSEASAYQRHLN